MSASDAPAFRPSITTPPRGTPPRSAAMTRSSAGVTPAITTTGLSMPSWIVSGERQTRG
jgi:hypothetical protein